MVTGAAGTPRSYAVQNGSAEEAWRPEPGAGAQRAGQDRDMVDLSPGSLLNQAAPAVCQCPATHLPERIRGYFREGDSLTGMLVNTQPLS